MTFRLVYRGPLHSNAGAKEKQSIRRTLHPQLADLWSREPLAGLAPTLLATSPQAGDGSGSLIVERRGYIFAPLITSKVYLVCHLDVLFLRPQDQGLLVQIGGDLDNRLKTLFDALQIPDANQIAADPPQQTERPFFCLLEDDALITQVSVETDRLLEPVNDGAFVSLIMRITIRATQGSWIAVDLAG